MTERRKLTDEEVAKLDTQQRELKALAEKQCIEQVGFLMREIALDTNISNETARKLLLTLGQGGFAVSLFRVTDANVDQKLNVQIVYAIDDDLEAYLRQPPELLPEKLRGFLDGGITLDMTKPAMVDLMPQTGKTRI